MKGTKTMIINLKLSFRQRKNSHLFAAVLASVMYITLGYYVFGYSGMEEKYVTQLVIVLCITVLNLVLTMLLSRNVKSLNLIHLLADSVLPFGAWFSAICVSRRPLYVAAAVVVFIISTAVIMIRYHVLKNTIPARRRPYMAIDIKAALCLSSFIPLLIAVTQI